MTASAADILTELRRDNPSRRFAHCCKGTIIGTLCSDGNWASIACLTSQGQWLDCRASGLPLVDGRPVYDRWEE